MASNPLDRGKNGRQSNDREREPDYDFRKNCWLWNWIVPSASAETNRLLRAAAAETWPYARWCAWNYLHDREAAFDLMDAALVNAAGYASRLNGLAPGRRLVWRVKSVLRREARQRAKRRRHELSWGSLADLETLETLPFQRSAPATADEELIADEIMRRLSPQARDIVRWLVMGYSWRRIARHLGLDRTTLRRAFDREVDALFHDLGHGDLGHDDLGHGGAA